MRKMATLGLIILLAGALAPVAATAPADDAGDEAFAQQAIQTLLCRKPRGSAEVTALAAIAGDPLLGRDVVIDVLQREPDFVDCWVPILTDTMQVQRSGEFAQLLQCFNAPRHVVDSSGRPCSDPAVLGSTFGCDPAVTCDCLEEATNLADHIRDAPPRTTTFDPDGDATSNLWNLHDAIRAAILVDDLHVAWRPWLFALAGAPQANGTALGDTRDNYLSTAFNVKTECIGCHSSSYSKTEVYPDASYAENVWTSYIANTWDRTATLAFDLHGDAFSTGTMGTITDPNGDYQTECAGCHGADGADWPYVDSALCPPGGGGFVAPKPHVERIPLLSRGAIIGQIVNGGECMPPIDFDGDGNTGMDDLDDVDSAGQLADFLHGQLGGWVHMDRFLDPVQFTDPSAVDGPWGLAAVCGFRWKESLVNDGALHAFGGLAVADTDVEHIVNVVDDGLAALPWQGAWPSASTPADSYLSQAPDPEASAGMLLAANIADDLIEEVLGGRATAPHGLSRMQDQSALLRDVIPLLAVDDGSRVRLSLKALLREVMLSPLYNRNAPDGTALTTSAYQLPMHVNPWAATSDGVVTTDGNNANGQGDLVHRRSPNEILWSLHEDLGWRAPSVFPDDGDDYPSREWMSQIGRYASIDQPGATAWQFSSLLLWEAGLARGIDPAVATDDGPCAKPNTAPDYIDVLVNSAFLQSPVPTVETLAIALKDRLLQETSLDLVSERPLMVTLLGTVLVPPPPLGDVLSAKASKWTKQLVKNALRQYCGALVTSPDYLLAGLPTVTAPQTPPPFQVAGPGEPTDHAAHYCTALQAMAPPLTCP